MFGKKKSSENPLPQPPTAEEILQDLEKAGPDDVVFTTEISALSCEKTLDSVPRDFALKKRFETTKEDSENSVNLYEKVIAYNQNVEKLETLSQKVNKKIEDLLETKEELTEELVKVIQSHSEAVKLHQKVQNHGNDN